MELYAIVIGVFIALIAFKCFSLVISCLCSSHFPQFVWQKYAPFVNMKGKVVIITGASDGLGKAAAGALASRGAHVIMGNTMCEVNNCLIILQHVDLKIERKLPWQTCSSSIKKIYSSPLFHLT